MRFIMSCEHECDPAVLHKGAQPIQILRMFQDLGTVPAPEFGPPLRIMAEPLSLHQVTAFS